MSDKPPEGGDEAVVRPRRLSWVWIIPIASVAIAGWLLWTTVARRGPTIDITFKTAESLQAGQTQVKYKDVQMGTVESIDLAKDRSKVIVHVRITSKAEDLVTDGAEFWVVKPRLFAGDISGLNTVLSGSYIEMRPGKPDKSVQHDFTGLEDPPAIDPDQPGQLYHLETSRLGALSVGSPVFFHDVEVGKIRDWKLVGMAEGANLNVFINAPYDKWVHQDSRFWSSSGVAVKLGADGVRLEVNSLKAALLGAISFDTPAGSSQPASVDANHVFHLFSTQEIADAAMDPKKVLMATYFFGSTGGLAAGAPVMFMGFPIGQVTSVELQFDTDVNRGRVRVSFDLQVDHVRRVGTRGPRPVPEALREMVHSGLRTFLKGGNLLTGQKQLALEFDSEAPPAELGRDGDAWLLPSSGGGSGFDDLTANANALLVKLGKMPFKQIGQNLNDTLRGASATLNGPELKRLLVRLNSTLQTVQVTVQHLDEGTVKRLPAAVDELQGTLAHLRSLTASMSAGTASDSKFARDLDRLLNQASDALDSVRNLTDLLARHPEALIRGRAAQVKD